MSFPLGYDHEEPAATCACDDGRDIFTGRRCEHCDGKQGYSDGKVKAIQTTVFLTLAEWSR